MATASGKSGPKRAMRVATIFTGVAACTVGVTQAAHAQGLRTDTAARPAGERLSGSIVSAIQCAENGIDKTWLHLSSTAYVGGGYFYTSTCFGFRGQSQSPANKNVRAECGGNNHGFLLGANSGRSETFRFGPGTTYHGLYWNVLTSVIISGWAGADKCPRAPDFGGGGESPGG